MDSHPNLCHGECAKSSHTTDENNEYAQSCLDAVMEAVWKDDDHDEFCGGANSYKTTDGNIVFQLKLNHIIIVVRRLLIILSWNLSASLNLKKSPTSGKSRIVKQIFKRLWS